jgi:hypothetical protein
MYDEDNDGRFPDESPVGIRYSCSKQEEQGDREQWLWLPGTVVEQSGPDEWYVCVEARELAVLRDGRRAPRGTASHRLYYPCCFRGSSESGPRATSSPTSATRLAWFILWLGVLQRGLSARNRRSPRALPVPLSFLRETGCSRPMRPDRCARRCMPLCGRPIPRTSS